MAASGAAHGFGSFRHLAVRFFGALSPHGPRSADEAWATALLLPGEQELWLSMSGADRRHAVGVARESARLLGGDPPREFLAAALLHDVGKIESNLGTFRRVFVTLAAMALGRDRIVGSKAKLAAKARSYLTHDAAGATMLTRAGSDDVTIRWAREHHLPSSRWTIPAAWGDALKQADGD